MSKRENRGTKKAYLESLQDFFFHVQDRRLYMPYFYISYVRHIFFCACGLWCGTLVFFSHLCARVSISWLSGTSATFIICHVTQTMTHLSATKSHEPNTARRLEGLGLGEEMTWLAHTKVGSHTSFRLVKGRKRKPLMNLKHGG